jgi:hypothetical protein
VVPAGCSAMGLSAATAADTAAVAAAVAMFGEAAPSGPTCVLQQLPSAAGQATCQDQSESGWCYVAGTCTSNSGVTCTADLCFTSAYTGESLSYQYTFLACP